MLGRPVSCGFPQAVHVLFEYIPEVESFVTENEQGLSKVINIIKSKENINSLSIYRITDGSDKIDILVETVDYDVIEDSLNETDIFSINEKSVLQELFSQEVEQISIQSISAYGDVQGQFIFVSNNLADLRLIDTNAEQIKIEYWKERTSYFMEVQNGWIMAIMNYTAF
jgi:hypothetical protein